MLPDQCKHKRRDTQRTHSPVHRAPPTARVCTPRLWLHTSLLSASHLIAWRRALTSPFDAPPLPSCSLQLRCFHLLPPCPRATGICHTEEEGGESGGGGDCVGSDTKFRRKLQSCPPLSRSRFYLCCSGVHVPAVINQCPPPPPPHKKVCAALSPSHVGKGRDRDRRKQQWGA